MAVKINTKISLNDTESINSKKKRAYSWWFTKIYVTYQYLDNISEKLIDTSLEEIKKQAKQEFKTNKSLLADISIGTWIALVAVYQSSWPECSSE